MTDDQLHREVARMARELSDKDREIERLRAERDEARRMWCEAEHLGNSISADAMDRRARAEAKRRQWDCFKETSK